LKSKAFEHAGYALTGIKGKVFDAHLGVDEFNLRGLDADRLLFFRCRIRCRAVVMLKQVFAHD
jgi:hypothetical protein